MTESGRWHQRDHQAALPGKFCHLAGVIYDPEED
jgi:hypothetical protein